MKVCISAGHGISSRTPGKVDSGAVGSGYREATVVLGMAKRLGQDFAVLGWPTLVRDSGYYANADNDAAAFGAQAFIELHMNAASASATGVEVLVGPNASRREYALAQAIADSVSREAGIRNRGVKVRTDLAVLSQYPSMDSVLAELAFVSNVGDMRAYQAHVDSIELGIVNAVLVTYGYRAIKSLPRKWSTAWAMVKRFLFYR